MKLIFGLGNLGEKYEKTRHNLGFMAVERFLKDNALVEKTVWEDSKKFKSEIAQFDFSSKNFSEKVILAKPKTYMNDSGIGVQLLSSFYKVQPSDIWVIHDDIDLTLGSMKIRFGGASAGHHGVESIMETLGTDRFWRFRLGIGANNQELRIKNYELRKRKIKNVDDFVLSEFGMEEQGKARELIKKSSKALQVALEKGLEKAMNRFNAK
ncbi:MAG: aminoacyl-tRNA hydrolase [Candidatus Levybacteria bacterium]|nr:aminoacyl-tRNA hydrolase [Candidatus Levybacteria bacterium]